MSKIINNKVFCFFIFMFICIIYSPCKTAYAANMDYRSNNILLLKACDETKNDYPVYEEMEYSENFNNIYNNSFLKESFNLFEEAKKYSDLDDKNIYIAFRKNSGCYGRIGFYLKKDNQLYDKTKSPYIELSTNDLDNNYKRLDSITQILPHEMGHVIYEIIAGVKDTDLKQMSMDMHYSDIVTEHSTAFNEGFGEHFQVISRIYEKNEDIKNSIYNELKLQKIKTDKIKDKAERDFKWNMRLDYYREISPLWQSRYESVKRNELSTTEECIYKNKKYDFGSPETTILYRNMGFDNNKNEKRSFEQSISTESVISKFFVELITSDKGTLNERYSKIFKVFNKYFKYNNRPDIIQFVNGYIDEYPEERARVLRIFKESTGYEFDDKCLEEIWCVAEDYHSTIILDQFNGIKCPIYTFNLNTCETEDLMKIKGIKKDDAEKIIAYRESIGGFTNREDIKFIKNIDSSIIDNLYKSSDIDTVNKSVNLVSADDNMLASIICQNIKHLLFKILFWIFIMFILVFSYYSKILKYSKIKTVQAILKINIKFIFYVVIGLICAFAQGTLIVNNTYVDSIFIYAAVTFVIEIIMILILRKDKKKQINNIAEFILISLIVLYSLY